MDRQPAGARADSRPRGRSSAGRMLTPSAMRCQTMTRKSLSRLLGGLAAGLFLAASPGLVGPAQAQAPAAKPNILFIMGDDIGFMQPRIYHRGLMVGETPNIDRIGNEGSIFMDYVAMQSCTSGRNAFFTGMYPL